MFAGLITNAIKRYTRHNTVEEFLGVDLVHNSYCNVYEDCFRYILRHSSGSPRSLIQFGKALDEAELEFYEPAERMKIIRDVVDDVSAENIFADYLESQKQMFMTTLNTDNRLRNLLKLIPSNVLTASSLRSINIKFCQSVGLNPVTSHPFCELFNSGMIGQVRFDAATGGYYQYFRKPHEFDWNQQEILDNDTVYVVHPGLISYLTRINQLYLNKFIVIEPDGRWLPHLGHTGIPKVFISHSSVDKQQLSPFLAALQDELNLLLPSELWIDQDRILAGDNIYSEVESGVSTSDILVLFASKHSLASGWVKEEWQAKHQNEVEDKHTRVIVAIIDDTRPKDLPPFLSGKLAAICPLAGSTENNSAYLAKAIFAQSTRLLNSIFTSSQ